MSSNNKYCRSFVAPYFSFVIHNLFGDADLFLGCATYFKTNIDGIECRMNVALLLSKANYSPEGVIYKKPFIFSDLIGCLYKPSLNITVTLSSGTFNVHVQPSYFADGEWSRLYPPFKQYSQSVMVWKFYFLKLISFGKIKYKDGKHCDTKT